MSNDQNMQDARAWVADCQWNDDPDDLAALSDEAIRAEIDRNYAGGWEQFVVDGNPS